jgi:hypothetical protein
MTLDFHVLARRPCTLEFAQTMISLGPSSAKVMEIDDEPVPHAENLKTAASKKGETPTSPQLSLVPNRRWMQVLTITGGRLEQKKLQTPQRGGSHL